jgi:hypothetical protein
MLSVNLSIRGNDEVGAKLVSLNRIKYVLLGIGGWRGSPSRVWRLTPRPLVADWVRITLAGTLRTLHLGYLESAFHEL